VHKTILMVVVLSFTMGAGARAETPAGATVEGHAVSAVLAPTVDATTHAAVVRRSVPATRQGYEAEQRAEEPEPEVVPCPTKLWTIPIELKGLACLLIIQKPAEEAEPAQSEAPAATEEEAEPTPVPCPTERWIVPLEVRGLACLLLIQKEEEKAPGEEAPAPTTP
jgi:hypothetical protein